MTGGVTAPDSVLRHYGEPFAAFSGQGELRTASGETFECSFEAGQLNTGRTILNCWVEGNASFPLTPTPIAFEGRTNSGETVTAGGYLHQVTSLGQSIFDDRGLPSTFRVQKLTVASDGSIAAYEAYALTNYLFEGISGRVRGIPEGDVLPLNISFEDHSVGVVIRKVADYKSRTARMGVVKGTDVTSEVVFENLSDHDEGFRQRLIDALCYVLSVSRGTKIQWVSRHRFDENARVVESVFFDRVTKQYSGLATIDPRTGWSIQNKQFIEAAIVGYGAKQDQFALNRGTIDLYLDARTEQDYLETRGAKLAVALEALKHVFLQAGVSTASEFVIPEQAWRDIVPKLQAASQPVLAAEGLVPEQIQALVAPLKLEGLNRRSFSNIVRKLFRYLGLREAESDLDLFVRCRNALVHQGAFYCRVASPADRDQCQPKDDPASEYFFMLHLLDRIFLRLLGHTGPYLNWAVPGQPQTSDLR